MRALRLPETKDEERFVFPFAAIPRDARIILYGGGIVGKTFLREQRRSPTCEILAVCDKSPEKTGIQSVPVITPDELCQREDYDMVLIAIEREDIALSIWRDLRGLGILQNKLRWINPAR